MAIQSNIEWTDSTWNPITGCTKISEGCMHCYAERMSKRLKIMGQKNYYNGFKVTLHENALNLPLKWKRPQTIFVNSMSDLFHDEVPEHFIIKLFEIMNQSYWHKFQILTKRADRLFALNNELPWSPNIWMGVSVENEKHKNRIDLLRNTDAFVKFISFEPLLGFMGNINLNEIDWVIVGGESGPGSRPILKEWIIDIKNQCQKVNVPFFFKQWGGVNKKKNGRLLEGKLWSEMPIPNKLTLISQEV